MWEANKRGLAIISTCCLRSSADSSSSSKRPLILPMLNPARVLASFTDTSLLRVVICPEPRRASGFRKPPLHPQLTKAGFAHRHDMGGQLHPGRPADPSPAPGAFNAGRCRASSRISSRLVRLSAIRCPPALSSFPPLLASSSASAKCRVTLSACRGRFCRRFSCSASRCA